MANGLYDRGRQGFLDKEIGWSGDNIKIMLIDEDDDVPNLATDEDLADRLAAARVATSGNLGTKTVTDGVADAGDVTFTAVTGDQSESVDCYQDTGVEGTSLLIFNIDTAVGLPVTPNGGDISVIWDDGANKIFRL